MERGEEMIPLKDTIPSRHLPIMTWLLIILNFVIFVYQLRLGSNGYIRLIEYFGLIPAYYRTGLTDITNIFPFISYIFLHSGWLHVVGNMWALWLFGDNVEDKMGSFRFLVFYIIMGVIAGMVHVFSDPSSTIPTIGGSGAIAGVMGAYFVMYPGARIVTLIPLFFIPLFFEIPAVIYLGFWLFSQVYSVIINHNSGTVSNIAWFAHIGGFLAGALFHRLFFQPYRERYRI